MNGTGGRRGKWMFVWGSALLIGMLSGRYSAQAVETETPKTIVSASGVKMIQAPAGEFVMGDERGRDEEKPRRVFVDSFLIAIYPVTQAEYEALIGDNPARWRNPKSPVEQVRWSDAVRYCNALSEKEGLTPAYSLDDWSLHVEADGYRLPTEAEWEYAARAGVTTLYPFGDDPAGLPTHAWFARNAGGRTRPVGMKRPNAWGLYDMLGNVWEWCHDYYAPERTGEERNPRGPATGEMRVLRGGAWDSGPDLATLIRRYAEYPGYADVCVGFDRYGFRIVRNAP
ncbi:MAG: SUMF1/EgtB/PvdO family nonheme iron enzyme [Kiritimatiellia bacterium]|nr:SUMF1/EgtB/PvdO family nonheme iron enzyme [Kiritimatiellia bacterium]